MRDGYSSALRYADRYIGVLACFVFSILHSLRRTPRDRTVKNVLIIELFEMGASVMAYSSLRHIKKTIGGGNIYCLCLKSTQASWLLLDVLPPENVFTIDDTSARSLAWSLFKQTRALSKKNIDLIIDYELFIRLASIASFLVRTKFRAGFYRYTMEGLYRGTFYDIKCSFNQNMHVAKNFLALTKSAMELSRRYYNYEGRIETNEIAPPAYRSDNVLRANVTKNLKLAGASEGPYILVAPTVGKMLPMRDYPKDGYAEVIRTLLAEYPRHRVILVGTEPHRETAEYIREHVDNERCINFAGRTESLAELLELFGMADLLISNDSGNPHFAAMVGLPNVVLFGPETPFVYGPLGKSVCLYEFFHSSPSITAYNHKNPPSSENECLRSISPECVVRAAEDVLAGKARWGTINNEIPYIL